MPSEFPGEMVARPIIWKYENSFKEERWRSVLSSGKLTLHEGIHEMDAAYGDILSCCCVLYVTAIKRSALLISI